MKKCLKCKKPFTEETKQLLCEHCAGEVANNLKSGAAMFCSAAILIISLGKINLKK